MQIIEKEVNLLSDLDHEAISKVIDFGYVDAKIRHSSYEAYHIVYEYADLYCLFDLIAEGKPFTVEE